MALLRYQDEEARNIAKARKAANQTARIESSLAKKLAAAEAATLQAQFNALKFKQTFGNTTSLSYVITHNKGTTDIIVQIQNLTGSLAVPDAVITNANTLTVSFDIAPGLNAFRAVII